MVLYNDDAGFLQSMRCKKNKSTLFKFFISALRTYLLKNLNLFNFMIFIHPTTGFRKSKILFSITNVKVVFYLLKLVDKVVL